MVLTLGDRQKEYEFVYDYKITKRIPIIIRTDGRAFSRLTKKLPRPYCTKMQHLMADTMLEVCKQMEGAVFAYQQSDEITYILKNDQSHETEPWFDNRVQKIASVSASLATYYFNHLYSNMDEKPNIFGRATFDARVFAVPSIIEAINNIIFRQQDCIKNSVSSASSAELSKLYGKKGAVNKLHGKNQDERKELLLKECEIDFEKHYPKSFIYGIAAYRIPKIIETENGQITRHQWALDMELPNFIDDKSFLYTILSTGKDIFRAKRDATINNTKN